MLRYALAVLRNHDPENLFQIIFTDEHRNKTLKLMMQWKALIAFAPLTTLPDRVSRSIEFFSIDQDILLFPKFCSIPDMPPRYCCSARIPS